MDSLSELEDSVITYLMKMKHKGKVSKYHALIKSAVKLEGIGCDGEIMMEVEKSIDSILSDLPDEDLHRIWQETENGQMDEEEGGYVQCRGGMIHDITIDALQAIAETICAEAKRNIASRRRKA